MITSIEIFHNPLNKVQQIDLVNNTIELIKSGEINPIKAELSLKSMECVIKAIRENKEVKSLTREESEKYGKKFTMFGAEIQNLQRTTYDYSACGDTVLNDMVNEMDKLKLQIKAREAMVATGVNPETGETYNPPQSSTSEFLTIKFL